MQKNRVFVVTMIGMFVAINVVLVRFLSFQTPITRIGFGFVSDGLCGMMFGPAIAGITAILSDLAGMLINNRGMPYFPGYTISAALYGVTYGLFLYRKPKTLKQISLCVGVQTIFIELVLGTLWGVLYSVFFLSHTKGVYFVFVSRLWQSLFMLPIKIAVLYTLAKALERTPYLPKKAPSVQK